jgi:predicted NBD/HSP70 family sugar kinase
VNLVNTTGRPSRGFGNDSLRRDNLATVLRLVHRSGAEGLSRSALTARTGMNRSTIAALVGELAERGLVAESEPVSRSGVGRPSPIVTTTERAVALAVNPEIDAIRLAVVGLGGRVLARHRVAARPDIDVPDVVELTATAARTLLAGLAPGHRVIGAGIAVPGLVRTGDGLVRLAPHFGWVDEPFTALLSVALDLPASAGNDATLGVLAEATFGAGRGIADLVYLNGGASGIGGGIVAGGRPLTGGAGYAGELGHTLVNSDGALCHCGATGCLETEVRRAPLLELAGLDDSRADELEEVLLASDDPAVRAEVDRQLGHLGVALRTAINTLNPERIVLGGFLAALYAVAPGQLALSGTARPLAASRESVEIVSAELGSDILMVGAAELAFAGLLADPTTFGTVPATS